MAPNTIKRFPEVSAESKEKLSKDFRSYFSQLCAPITASSEISFHRCVFDSLQLVRETSWIEFTPLYMFLTQKWFDSHRTLVHLAASRKFAHLDEKKQAEVAVAAKELNVFLTQTSYMGINLKNDYLNLCVELIVRAAPVNKFYKTFLESTFTDLSGAHKQIIFNALLETFNPDECRFFSAIIIKENDGIGLELFQNWYQKLVDCNFQGSDIERHLAEFTASLLIARIGYDDDVCDLLKSCLRRVSIRALMEFTLNHHLYYYALQRMPIDVLKCVIDRFMEAGVFENIPVDLQIVYGRVLVSFGARDNDYLTEVSGQRREMYDTFCSVVERSTEAAKFVRNEYGFLKSLTGPMTRWSLETLERAANGFEFVANNFIGICELDISIPTSLPNLNGQLLEGIKLSFYTAPSKAIILPTVKLLFALLKTLIIMVQVDSKAGVEGMKLLSLFNTHFWPEIKDDLALVDRVRSFYPILYYFLEFIVNSAMFFSTAASVSDFHSVIFNLSENPMQEFHTFANTLLLQDCTQFFEFSIRYGSEVPYFDEYPFFHHLVRQAARFEELDFIDRQELKGLFSLFLDLTSNTSDTNLSALKLLNDTLFK